LKTESDNGVKSGYGMGAAFMSFGGEQWILDDGTV
jgi:hypothetical protein